MYVAVYISTDQPTDQPLAKVITYFYYCNAFDMDGALYVIGGKKGQQ